MRLALFAILLLTAILSCACEAQYPRPRRPESFDNAKDMGEWLRKMKAYYSVVGGRFGKRDSPPAAADDLSAYYAKQCAAHYLSCIENINE